MACPVFWSAMDRVAARESFLFQSQDDSVASVAVWLFQYSSSFGPAAVHAGSRTRTGVGITALATNQLHFGVIQTPSGNRAAKPVAYPHIRDDRDSHCRGTA